MVAQKLLIFAQTEVFARNPHEYSGWDSRMGYWLKEQGIESYMPYRYYGEHGGRPNSEHRRAGFRPHHRADVLFGSLAFVPAYAEGSVLRFLALRARARLWGLARLAGGRFTSWGNFWRSKDKAMLLRVILGRHFLRAAPAIKVADFNDSDD